MLLRRKSCPLPNETDRVRRIFEKQAPKYDRTHGPLRALALRRHEGVGLLAGRTAMSSRSPPAPPATCGYYPDECDSRESS